MLPVKPMVASPRVPRGAQRRQNVRRSTRGGQRQQHVPLPAETCDLSREHLFEAVIIGDRRQRRGVGGQRDRRVSRPLLLVAADDFGGDMLGVGGAAAIADDQQLVASAKRADDDFGDFPSRREQARILRRALKRCARKLQMGSDRVFGILAQATP